jgi:hypothetical protein
MLFLRTLMRAVYLFFILLCFLLLRGDSYAYSRAHHNMLCYSPAHTAEKFQQIKSAVTKQDQVVITTADSKADDELLIDVDDEDENTLFAKNIVLPAKYFLLLSYTFILSYFYFFSRLNKQLPPCKLISHDSSCRYLQQRALRI